MVKGHSGKHSIKLASGVYFDLADPDPRKVLLSDVAHHLSLICRYTGACRRHYSVALHSVLVSYLTKPENAFAGLMHDAPEYVIGDVSHPLKVLLPDYRAIECKVEACMWEAFDIEWTPEVEADVKRADVQALALERQYLMADPHEPWYYLQGVEVPRNVQLIEVPWYAKFWWLQWSKRRFLRRFEELTA